MTPHPSVALNLLLLAVIIYLMAAPGKPTACPLVVLPDPTSDPQVTDAPPPQPTLRPMPKRPLASNGGHCLLYGVDGPDPIDEMIALAAVNNLRPLKYKVHKLVLSNYMPAFASTFTSSPSVLRYIPPTLWEPYCASMSVAKAAVTGGPQRTYTGIVDGSHWPPHLTMTMSGYRRLNNAELLMADAIHRGIPGNFIETGVWKGGLSAVVATALTFLDPSRKVFLADSFQGIPFQGKNASGVDRTAHQLSILNKNSVKDVKSSFNRLGLLGEGTEFLVGYFNDTLLPAAKSGKFDNGFAVIRLDGDTYLSTMQALTVLYPLLSVGGYAIIDDYLSWRTCREAVTDYRRDHRIQDPIVPVYHEKDELVSGVFWRKSKPIQ